MKSLVLQAVRRRPAALGGLLLLAAAVACACSACLPVAAETTGESAAASPLRRRAWPTHGADCRRAVAQDEHAAEPHRVKHAIWHTDEEGDRGVELAQAAMPGHRGDARVLYSARPDFPAAGFGPNLHDGQGSYVTPGRTSHVPQRPGYRLRVNDELDLIYRVTRDETSRPYQLNVGDEIRVEMLNQQNFPPRDLIVQPYGTITLPYLGQVRASKRTVEQLREELEKAYAEIYKRPEIVITPLKVNRKLLDIINTVDSRYGTGGQVRSARVVPDGTIALPVVGTVPVQGMTLEELKRELFERYAMEVEGIEVQPVLTRRAPRFVYVVGEVLRPGRHEMVDPTTVIQAITLAGGVTSAATANLRQVAVFRRGPNWELQATMLDLYDPIISGSACPYGDIWAADSDVIVVPKTRIRVIDEFIEAVFTRGIYGVVPFDGASINFSKASTL